MKKVSALPMRQKGKEFFIAVADPRIIIKLAKIPKKNTSQDAQRPWLEKRVKEIAKYAAGLARISDDPENKVLAKGLIPNCPILSISSPLQVYKESGAYFINLPENEKELEPYRESVQILDGQHRLIAFSDEYLDVSFKDSEQYEIGLVLFSNLTVSEMREIFMITNDKQEKMEQNVLRQIKKWLGLLSEEEDRIYQLIERLNKEPACPLQRRIIVGGNKVPNGFKLTQVLKIFRNSKLFELLKNQPLDSQIIKVSQYLRAWSQVYTGMYNNPKHTLGKVAGLRYIIYLFPYIHEILKEKRAKLTEESIVPILHELYNMNRGSSMFEDQSIKLAFRGESGTVALARSHGMALKETILNHSEIFDPLQP